MATDDEEKKDEASAADATEKAPSVSEGVSDEAVAEKVAVKDAEKPAIVEPHDPHAGEGEELLVAEPDRVNVGVIGALTFAIIVATVAVVIGVQQFFTQTIAGEVSKKLYEPEDPMKKELAAIETAKLHKYQWASQKDGIVRIPVERARELVLAEYGKMAAYEPGAIAPAPTASVVSPEPATSASAAPSTSVSAAPSTSVAPPASASAAPSTSASVPHKH